MTATINTKPSTQSHTQENITRVVIGWILNTIFHQILAIVSAYAVWFAYANFRNPFSWHVIFATLGYVPVMAEAIVLFAGDNVWTQRLERRTRYKLHGVLLVIGTIALTAGISVEIHSKVTNKRSHFRSAHAITGFVSMILAILSLFLGFLSYNARSLKAFARPVWFKLVHNFLGMASFALGVTSLILGFQEHSFIAYHSEESRIWASIATAFVGVYALHAAFVTCYRQVVSAVGG